MRYRREDGCRAWLSHAMLPLTEIEKLMEEEGSAEAVYDHFVQSGGQSLADCVHEQTLSFLRDASKQDAMHRMMLTMRQHDMGLLSWTEDAYPDAFRCLDDPPAFLFYQGDPLILRGKCITMVGSRSVSPSVLEATHAIARTLSEFGVVVVSGLAMGVDAAAHRGCLEGGSPTAAVLGCGLDIRYPVENEELRKEILDSGGLLLSEYPPGTPALGWHFPVRNRLLAALGRAMLMMECKIRSGSMTSVQHALNQGKDVYAYPGRVGTPWAEGAHQLLREGALYFTSAEDVLNDLEWTDHHSIREEKNSAVKLPSMDAAQHRVFAALTKDECSFDQLCSLTGMEPADLSVTLTMLQLTGLIKTLPGKCYARV